MFFCWRFGREEQTGPALITANPGEIQIPPKSSSAFGAPALSSCYGNHKTTEIQNATGICKMLGLDPGSEQTNTFLIYLHIEYFSGHIFDILYTLLIYPSF